MPDLDILLPALALALGLVMLVRTGSGRRAASTDVRSQRILWGLLTLVSAILLVARFLQD